MREKGMGNVEIRETAVTGQNLNFSIGHVSPAATTYNIVVSTDKSHRQLRYFMTMNFFSNAAELMEKFRNRGRRGGKNVCASFHVETRVARGNNIRHPFLHYFSRFARCARIVNYDPPKFCDEESAPNAE